MSRDGNVIGSVNSRRPMKPAKPQGILVGDLPGGKLAVEKQKRLQAERNARRRAAAK